MAKSLKINRRTGPIDALIGNRLRQRRIELHVTQQALADALGVTFQQIQKYEKGMNRMGVGRLSQAAHRLKVELSYFTGDLDGKKPVPMITELNAFLATSDGVKINEAMLALDGPNRKAVIALARSLAQAYG